MIEVSMTGNFDNGHDFYQVDAVVQVNENTKELTHEEIREIVQDLERADRRRHGKSYRGKCTDFQISNYELEYQEELGNLVYNEKKQRLEPVKGDMPWLDIFVDKNQIAEAFEAAE